jgi:glycosyltransferase involved in cell wall biosynthesis
MNQISIESNQIAVVIPCYKVTNHVLGVIAGIGPEVWRIYAVDDKCPDGSGDFIEQNNVDPRVVVLRNEVNLGVGGAVMHGYRQAIADGAAVIVKVDGDGQMDTSLIMNFAAPICAGEADYTKGNRFFRLDEIRNMPSIRLFGNAVLSLLTKLSSGYWDLFDPTNGYTAIHADVARHLPFDKISSRYFFETDILFRLNIMRAMVLDIPMDAKYGDEVSNLKISKIIGEFLGKHLRNFSKRIFYNYYLRDLSLGSFELPLGVGMVLFGLGYGSYHFYLSAKSGLVTPTGVVMMAALPLILGVQFVLGFLAQDIASVPKRCIHAKLKRVLRRAATERSK